MERIYRHQVKVNDSDIDAMGHINNVSYVAWMQDAAVAHSAENGWDWERYQKFGAGFVAREHHIEYLSQGFVTDAIYAETWVSGMKKVSSTREYWFFREDSDQILARASTKWAFVSLERMAPARIPAELAGCFQVIERTKSGG